MTIGDKVRCKRPPRFARWTEGETGEVIEIANLPDPTFPTHYIVEMDQDGAIYAFTADEIEPEYTTAAVS